MTIQTRCARCGQQQESDSRTILAGPAWKLCPACRDDEGGGPGGSVIGR